MMKRTFDIISSFIAILIAFPLMIVVALLIKLETKGDVVFTQQRVGRGGDNFRMYKFRSMVVDASKTGPYFTQKNDSRITGVGKIIRKTSIDELPQLINVFKGDMSIVGPRPNVPVQKKEYSKAMWDKRNSVRPGITGLAQALLRSAATADQRTSLDLEYVDKFSLSFDIKIIFMTIKQVIVGVRN